MRYVHNELFIPDSQEIMDSNFVHFIEMDGNIMLVGQEMSEESPRQDTVVFTISKAIPAKDYLEESRQLFERQIDQEDFDQFNVNRVLKEIGQIDS